MAKILFTQSSWKADNEGRVRSKKKHAPSHNGIICIVGNTLNTSQFETESVQLDFILFF